MKVNLLYQQSDPVTYLPALRQAVPDLDGIVALTDGVPGMFGQDEMHLLACAAMLAPRGAPFVELGPYCGRSTIILAGIAARRGCRVVTIDNFRLLEMVPEERREGMEPSSVETILRNVGPTGADVTVVDSYSHLVPEGVGAVGLLFIDTDHRAACLDGELDAWLPLMLPQSVVALHDYCADYPDYVEVINQRLALAPDWDFVAHRDKVIVFRGAT